MKRFLISQLLLLPVVSQLALAIQAPTGVISLAGDQSVVLHWDRSTDASLLGYRVYRSINGVGGPFSLLSTSLLTGPGYCDLNNKVINGQTNYYYATAVDTGLQESLPSATVGALPHPFASDDEFLDYVQQTCFDYFWYGANPANGLVPDRSATNSTCSIAAVGFGLTAISIAADHGWITRTQAVARVLATLKTFLQGPQGPGTTGIIGYKGWFYHFLDMNTALRSGSELSSIDTALLLGGILYAKQYFNGPSADETSIRTMADAIFNRVDWAFMAQGTDAVAMGWQPTSPRFRSGTSRSRRAGARLQRRYVRVLRGGNDGGAPVLRTIHQASRTPRYARIGAAGYGGPAARPLLHRRALQHLV